MVKSGERHLANDQCVDAAGQNSEVEDPVDVSTSGIETPATANQSFSRRLTDIFLEDGDDDLLLQRTDIRDGFLQWLGALDMQVMVACRADERLKPLLKLNIYGGEAEDRLLAQLCEHFEPSEVGLLARCLCAPLVSIRVGKINMQGTLLCPTSVRSYLVGSIVSNAESSGVLPSSGPSGDDSVSSLDLHFPQSSFTCEKRSQFQQYDLRGSMTDPNPLDGLYPKPGSFEASLPKCLSSKHVTARENLMQVGDDNALPNSLFLASTNEAKGKLPGGLVNPVAVLHVNAFGKPLDLTLCCPEVQVHSSSSSHLSPHYCWCPPVASTLHYTLGNSKMSTESLHLPPFSSLLTSKSSLSLSEVPAVDFPVFQPEPLITSVAISQQFPTFTALMCDPTVHIPIYSWAPGYLVSTGPAIATTIPPLNLNPVDPLISNSKSVVEQTARDTLRMLINNTNSQPNSKRLEMLPPVLSSSDNKQNLLSIGESRGFIVEQKTYVMSWVVRPM